MNLFSSPYKLFIANRFLCGPLEALYTILIFIVNKELISSLLMLSVLASAKHFVSLIGFYLNDFLVNRPHRRRPFLICMNLLGALPTLFFPFMQNGWLFVASYVLFMTSLRAVYPAWTEILKAHEGKEHIGKAVSRGTSITYLMITFVPLLFSYWLDRDHTIWKSLFVLVGLLQITNTILLIRLPIAAAASTEYSPSPTLLLPWKRSFQLLLQAPDFAKYLVLFFLGGMGIIMIQPFLPQFFHENLGLSYVQLSIAISLCKGIGFLVASPRWAAKLQKISLYRLNGFVNLFSCLFIASLLSSELNINFLFLAYIIYGVMQAGYEMGFNVSGIVFSKQEESIAFSNANLALIGLRGCLCPFLGQLLILSMTVHQIFALCGAISLLGLFYALFLDRKLCEVRA